MHLMGSTLASGSWDSAVKVNRQHGVCRWQVYGTVTLSISDALSCIQVWAVSTSASVTLTEVAEFDHEGEVIYSVNVTLLGLLTLFPLGLGL